MPSLKSWRRAGPLRAGHCLRPHAHWPKTILRTAMRGHPEGCKKFIGETFVQRLVDKQWRGNTYYHSWELPGDVSVWGILAYCVFGKM